MLSSEIPAAIHLGFIVLTFLLLIGVFRIYALKRSGLVFVGFLICAWLILTGTLASYGILSNFESMPPRLLVLVITAFSFLLWLSFFSPWKHALLTPSQTTLVALQSFRLPVELLLWGLATHQLLPVEMTFHGRNFDILTGISALPIAYFVHRMGEKASRNVLILWNIMGLLLVSVVVIHGMLSVPYPFQVLDLQPANRVVTLFPVIWLPMFLVPMAYYLHITSLRKVFSQKT